MRIYKANFLYTTTPGAFEVLEKGCVAVDSEGRITDVCNADEAAALLDAHPEAEVLDFGDRIIIPGMYDLHVHAPQYRNEGVAMDLELLPWLQTYTFPEEAKYCDLDYARVMYQHFVNDLLRQGTVRAAVFATIHPEATKLLAHEFDRAGMGAMIGLVGMNRNCPTTLSNTPEEAVRGTREIIEETRDMPLVSAIVTPRFIPSCTPDMLTALGQLAGDEQLPVQSHLSENKSEIAWVSELEPESACYGDAYNRYGLFGQTPTLMAHCVYTDGEELALVKKNGVMVVHCPTSNCNLASGIAPIRRYLDRGIPVALGSDISGGHHLSIFRVMQYAQQMSKLRYAESNGTMPFLTLSEVFHMATKVGGSFFGRAGSFEVGYDFDALVIDDTTLTQANSEAGAPPYSLLQRLERFIYLGDERNIEARYCQGKHLQENPL